MEDMQLEQEEVEPLALATGGNRPRVKPQPFHVDVIATTDLGGRGVALLACAGSIVSQSGASAGWEQPPQKALAFWVSDGAAVRKDGRHGVSSKLEVDNASHVLFTGEVEDKFVSLDVKEYDHDESCTYVSVFASTRTQLLRWNLCLSGIDFTVGSKKWKDLPSPQVLSLDVKEVEVGHGYATEVRLGDCSEPFSIQEDAGSEEMMENIAEGRTDNSWIMSLTLEGSDLVLRDARLSIVWGKFNRSLEARQSPSDGTAVAPPSSSALSATPDEVTCFKFLSSYKVLVAYGDGRIALWDISPCVHIDLLDGEDSGKTEYLPDVELERPPALVFLVTVEYPVCQVLEAIVSDSASVSRGEAKASLPLVIASRDGRLRNVVVKYSPSLAEGKEAGTGTGTGTGTGVAVVMERYVTDLRKETRYLVDGAAAEAVVGGAAQGQAPLSHSIKGNLSSLPLALALVEGEGAEQEQGQGGSPSPWLVCVVTTSAVLHLSYPGLTLHDLLPLKDVAGISASAAVTNSITGAAVSGHAVGLVPAFDREARVLARAGAGAGARGSDRLASKLAASASERQQQRRAREGQRAAGVVIVGGAKDNSAAVAETEAGAGASVKAGGGAHVRSALSLFLSQEDMLTLGRLRGDEDDEDDDEEGDGRAGEGKENVRRSPLLASFAPPPTPMMNRGAGANAASTTKGRAAYNPAPSRSASASASASASSSPRKKPTGAGGASLDKPVTFHAKIKSSGYGQAPNTALGVLEKRRKERQKQAAKERAEAQAVRSGTAPAGSSPRGVGVGVRGGRRAQQQDGEGERAALQGSVTRYPTECGIMHVHQKHNDYCFPKPTGDSGRAGGAGGAGAGTSLSRLTFSSDGSLVGVASSDSAVSVLRLPMSRFQGEGSHYVSHNRSVTKVAFSHNQKSDPGAGSANASAAGGGKGVARHLVLSSSDDGTARLWRGGKVDGAVIEFTHERCTSSSSSLGSSLSRVSNGIGNTSSNVSKAAKTTATTRRNRPYEGPVVDASFYYNDKFVVLGNSNAVYMYSYQCESIHANNDLKRLRSSGSYKQAHHWRFAGARNVTAVECVNGILSPLIFAATSSKSLHVCDTVSGTVCRSIENVHGRPVHSIALPQPSVYVQLDQSAYNVFATAATDNCVSVWDLRAPSVCVRYTAHTNRRESVQCALSPCLRYLACGSEDKSAHLVDLRTGAELAKYTGYRDVVSAVAFHPLSPQIATAAYDGTIKFYCSSSS